MALYELPDAEHALAKVALDRVLARPPAELLVHLGPSTLRRAVWALPAVDAALARLPRARVAWAARPAVCALLAGHLEARRGAAAVARPPNGATPGPRLVLSLDAGPPPAACGPEGASLSLRVRPARRPGDAAHAAARWARGASNAGLPGARVRPALEVPPGARRQAQAIAHALAGRWDRPLLALLPARRPARRWGPGPLAALARALAERTGARAIVWPPEPIDGALPLSADLAPTTAAALLSLCALCVGDDDGWAHVAAAVGAPTLTVHGPTCPERCGPASPRGLAWGAPPCRRPAEHASAGARRCLRCLEPAAVLDAAERLAAERWPHDLVARWR